LVLITGLTTGAVGAGFYAGGVSLIVHLPEELARRVEKVAEARQLPAPAAVDALEAFIASGRSGRHDLGRRHREIKSEITDGLTATH